jgi:hypothetical protein
MGYKIPLFPNAIRLEKVCGGIQLRNPAKRMIQVSANLDLSTLWIEVEVENLPNQVRQSHFRHGDGFAE